MKSHRTTATIVGILFLVVNVAFLAGVFSIESVLGTPLDPELVSGSRGLLAIGVLLELTNGVAYIGIAVLMFPLLRQQSANLALGYVVFRSVEFAIQIASDISALSLLGLSEGSMNAGAPGVSSFQALSNLLLSQRQSAILMGALAFAVGALLFYVSLFQSLLIPRFISVWGLVAAAVVLVSTALEMFGVNPGNLGILMLLNELFLGVWLIAKGFNPTAMATEPVHTGA
jgi:hypothetical protein